MADGISPLEAMRAQTRTLNLPKAAQAQVDSFIDNLEAVEKGLAAGRPGEGLRATFNSVQRQALAFEALVAMHAPQAVESGALDKGIEQVDRITARARNVLQGLSG